MIPWMTRLISPCSHCHPPHPPPRSPVLLSSTSTFSGVVRVRRVRVAVVARTVASVELGAEEKWQKNGRATAESRQTMTSSIRRRTRQADHGTTMVHVGLLHATQPQVAVRGLWLLTVDVHWPEHTLYTRIDQRG